MRAEPVLQAEVIIGGTSVVLADSEDRRQLRRQIEEAAATNGRFVDIEASDGSEVNVFVTPTTHVSFHTRQVSPEEARSPMVLSVEGNWDLL
ncbi:hypothetical protein FIV50_12805 [Microbacterium foliorum]|uniref:Uncharacterized protein n=1 Tax=Microbacterium foliorum TaxID=104336 RepID=A0A4Y5YS72_9MICO|nr:hypothetical protein [Microbacterium foliorum]QDE35587.1 hypothetical protein FIV50_12805 [Microbacterium foliorum]